MIYLGADHAGFKLKEQVRTYFDKKGIAYMDEGAFLMKKEDDYPDYAKKVALKIKKGDVGILFCGSSLGVCIAANKFKGIRAVSVTNKKEAKLSREHNNANVLCLSGWNCKKGIARKIIDIFLDTGFSEETRHRRRVRKVNSYDNS